MMRAEREGTGWQWQKPPSGLTPVNPDRDRGPTPEEIKENIHQRLIEELDSRRLEAIPEERRRGAVESAAKALLAEEVPDLVGIAQDQMIAAIVDEVLGLGPIEPLVLDPDISEVMVNGPDQIFVEREGRLFRVAIRFKDEAHMMRIIERIVAPIGRRVDESSPMVDARLPDGSRVNITIPPVSPKAPSITIRKFKADKYRIEELIAGNTLSQEVADFLEACVRIRLNILVSGGTGSGKTTLLNALSAFIPQGERIVTIEDPAELKLQREHVVTLEARPPSIEDKGQVTQRDLVRNALRMRPDRIIVGEVRGGEAFDMLQAMNTGHEGSLTTVHSNSPRDALARVENMVLMAGFDLPLRAIREQIASAIHLVIQIARLSDGSRRIIDISEVTGIEGQTVTMQEIFKLANRGQDGEGRIVAALAPTGLRPTFAERFGMAGISLSSTTFLGSGW